MCHGVGLALMIPKQIFFLSNFEPCETMPVNLDPKQITKVPPYSENQPNCLNVDFDSSKEGSCNRTPVALMQRIEPQLSATYRF